MSDGSRLPGVDDGTDEDPIILHVDADCFYAACERLREPALCGEPLVIGMGYEPEDGTGAVATASYEAREYGVESAMAISTALDRLSRRDPPGDDRADGDAAGTTDAADGGDGGDTRHDSTEADATGYYRPVDIEYYESVAADVKSILHECADVVREVSIDEAYLDVTDRTAWAVADGFARHVKDRIRREVGITVSVGVAPTMSAAKVASDFDKPDGLTVVKPGAVSDFLSPLDVEHLHGVGPVTARELRSMGLETAGDVAATDPEPLVEAFGERGRELYDRARGEDDRRVEPRGRPKSFSRESAFASAVEDRAPKYEQLETLAAAVAERARREGALYRTVGVKAVTPPYEVNTRERSLSGPVDDPELVERIAKDLFAEFESVPVRKLGVRVANLEFTDVDQPRLDSWEGSDSSGTMGTDGAGASGSKAADSSVSAGTPATSMEDGPREKRTRVEGQTSLADFS